MRVMKAPRAAVRQLEILPGFVSDINRAEGLEVRSVHSALRTVPEWMVQFAKHAGMPDALGCFYSMPHTDWAEPGHCFLVMSVQSRHNFGSVHTYSGGSNVPPGAFFLVNPDSDHWLFPRRMFSEYRPSVSIASMWVGVSWNIRKAKLYEKLLLLHSLLSVHGRVEVEPDFDIRVRQTLDGRKNHTYELHERAALSF